MQKFSSFGRKKKQTKIRHRMVMLEGLQLLMTPKQTNNRLSRTIDGSKCTSQLL